MQYETAVVVSLMALAIMVKILKGFLGSKNDEGVPRMDRVWVLPSEVLNSSVAACKVWMIPTKICTESCMEFIQR